MAVTIRDIARLSGTSIAAVSRVLNGQAGVRPLKRESILRVARDLGYIPNRGARNLAMQRTHIIGVIASDLSNPNYIDFIQHVENLGRKRDYQILIAASNMKHEREVANVATMLEHRADGLLIFPVGEFGLALNADHFMALWLNRTPFVIHGAVQRGAFDAVCMDEEELGYVIGKHLTDFGHKRLAVAGSPFNSETARQRYAGFQRAATEAGARIVCDDLAFEAGEHDLTGVHGDFWRARFQEPGRPTALFTFSDTYALCFYNFLRNLGFAIPDDISIASVGNEPFSAFLSPPLTTADPRIGERARLGMKMLLERIETPGAPPVVQDLQYEFIPRESTGPCQHGS